MMETTCEDALERHQRMRRATGYMAAVLSSAGDAVRDERCCVDAIGAVLQVCPFLLMQGLVREG